MILSTSTRSSNVLLLIEFELVPTSRPQAIRPCADRFFHLVNQITMVFKQEEPWPLSNLAKSTSPRNHRGCRCCVTMYSYELRPDHLDPSSCGRIVVHIWNRAQSRAVTTVSLSEKVWTPNEDEEYDTENRDDNMNIVPLQQTFNETTICRK